MCLRQIFRSKIKIRLPKEMRPDGWGDCSKCAADEKNKECMGYCYVKVRYYYVKTRRGQFSKIEV